MHHCMYSCHSAAPMVKLFVRSVSMYLTRYLEYLKQM